MAESIKAEKIDHSEDDILNTTLDDFDFLIRTRNCLLRSGFKTIGDIVQKPRSEIMRVHNLGRRSFEEIEQRLSEIGLSLKP